jgi:hypothetical protein
MAQPAVVAATFGGHEYTLGTFADRLTNHGNHLPSQISQIMKKKQPEPNSSGHFFLLARRINRRALQCQGILDLKF